MPKGHGGGKQEGEAEGEGEGEGEGEAEGSGGAEKKVYLMGVMIGHPDGCATSGSSDVVLRTTQVVTWLVNLMRGNCKLLNATFL